MRKGGVHGAPKPFSVWPRDLREPPPRAGGRPAVKAPYPDYQLPPDKEALLRRARRVAWASIALLATIIAAVGLTMGSSQTMKAMWVEDAVSLIPSVAFLVGIHYRRKPPDDRFPYAYRRAVLIAFLAGAVTLLGFGLWMAGDSVYKLV